MKRFLKVILILAAVFGVAGLGLTAGGAAMGATMGDGSWNHAGASCSGS